MKTLSELGISPAPWQWDGDERTDDMVLSADGRIAEWMNAKDARLCAAAPDLYEACRMALGVIERNAEDGAQPIVGMMRAALEKAGGAMLTEGEGGEEESEADDE